MWRAAHSAADTIASPLFQVCRRNQRNRSVYTQNGSQRAAYIKMLAYRLCSCYVHVPHGAFAGRRARNGSRQEVSSMTDKVPIIVVLGIDIDSRAHASRFEERDAPF